MKKEYELKIDEAVQKLHYVRENNVIDIYADYRDAADFLLDTIYDNRDGEDLEALVQEQIHEGYVDTIWQYENEILKKAGLDGTELEEEALDYLRDTYCIEPPYDHFLGQEIKVNIMLATSEERDHDCADIHDQYLAMVDPDALTSPDEELLRDTGLTRLLKQQGHSMDELQATMKDYNQFFYDADSYSVRRMYDENGKRLSGSQMLELFNQNHNAFLASVCQELENQSYSMGVLTVLAKMSISDFIKMQQGQMEITMPKDCMVGIFNPWNGSGSVLEIELEKPLVFSSDLVRDVQIEGVKPQYQYTVDDSYGLIGSCWKEPISIGEAKKLALDDVIKSCAAQVVDRDVEAGSIDRDR